MNKTLCSAFWMHTNVRSGDRIFPCCRYKTPVADFNGDIQNILNLPIYDQLRNNSLNGVQNPCCQKCYYEEEMGKSSLRQEFNSIYDINEISLKYLEIGFDNICNLTCDGCWGEFSSSWAEKENPNLKKKFLIKKIKSTSNIPNTIEKIVFLGGEPLMTNRHHTFLKKIQNKNSVTVTYYTNGTFLFKEKDIELLDQFKSVNIIVSIDGFNKLNETVRSGSNWNDIIKFLNQLKSTKYNKTIHSVIHLNNWNGLEDLSNFVTSTGIKWTTNILTYPSKLDIINLSIDEKYNFREILSKIYIPNKEYLLKHIGFVL